MEKSTDWTPAYSAIICMHWAGPNPHSQCGCPDYQVQCELTPPQPSGIRISQLVALGPTLDGLLQVELVYGLESILNLEKKLAESESLSLSPLFSIVSLSETVYLCPVFPCIVNSQTQLLLCWRVPGPEP